MVRALLLKAMVEYCMLILTINAFPDITTQLDWAKKCFKNACRVDNVRFSMTEHIVKLVRRLSSLIAVPAMNAFQITKRGSWIRGQIITQCRALFVAHYKFNRSSMSRQAITANRDLSEALKTGAHYHYKVLSFSYFTRLTPLTPSRTASMVLATGRTRSCSIFARPQYSKTMTRSAQSLHPTSSSICLSCWHWSLQPCVSLRLRIEIAADTFTAWAVQ